MCILLVLMSSFDGLENSQGSGVSCPDMSVHLCFLDKSKFKERHKTGLLPSNKRKHFESSIHLEHI